MLMPQKHLNKIREINVGAGAATVKVDVIANDNLGNTTSSFTQSNRKV